MYKVKFAQAQAAVASNDHEGEGGGEGTGMDAAAQRIRAHSGTHPDAELGGFKPILTALQILAGESHTLDLCSLAAALHRRRQRAVDRAMALEALESMLVGLSNGDSDTASNRLLSADVLWCLPDCLRTRSAYDRRRGIRTGGGNPFEPGPR